jgi:DNA-binding CsgD family transcriptional regulator
MAGIEKGRQIIMRCARCGRSNRPDATFCDACGAKFDDSVEHVQAIFPSRDRVASSVRLSKNHADRVFVGRQAEMGALQAALEDALAGRGRLVLLVGEPGIGKTRIAREFASHTELRGAQVLWGRCHEHEGAPPYWPWIQIIRTYVRVQDAAQIYAEMGGGAADIAEIVPDVRELLPDLPYPPQFEDSGQARFRLFDAITAFLCEAARHHPRVLILDNLHWADRPSLLLLEFLTQELSRSRLLIVGTYRDTTLSRQHPLSETLAELTREHALQRLFLHGLHREEVGRFLKVTTDFTPSQALVEAVYTQTEGNPLFLTEVVRLLIQAGEFRLERGQQCQGVSLRIPEGVRDVIGKRLNHLSPPCNQMLTIAAVVGREFGLEELVRLVDGVSEERVLEMLEEAVAAHVIEEVAQAMARYQFTHALIQATLYDEMTTVRRVRLHRRVGEVLEEVYSTNCEPYVAQLAHHFCAAAQRGNVDKAITYATRAGARALTLLAYDEAVHHYERALRLLEDEAWLDEAQRCKLLLALGEAQRQAGAYPQAMDTFQRAADAARRLGLPESLAHAALGFEETTWRPGLPGDVAARLLEEALRGLAEGDSSLKARVLGNLARALLFTGAFAPAAAVEAQAVEMARRIGDPATLAATLKARFFARFRPEQITARLSAATELISLAKAVHDRETVLNAYAWRLFDLMELGDIEAVDSQLTIYTRLVEELRHPFYLYVNTSFRAMRAIFAGHFAEGESLAQETLAIGQRLRGQDTLGIFGVQMFTLRREQGRLQELAPVVQSFVHMHPETSTWRPGLALLYSELGLAHEARAEFEHLATNDFATIPQDALWVTCITYLSEVCAFLGDACRAAILYQCLAPHDGYNIVVGPTAACYGAASYYLGLLAATMARWEEAQRHFTAALTMNARMGAKPALARTQYTYARMLLRRGQPGDHEHARSLLDEALALSHALGMRALEEQTVALQERLQSPSRSTLQYPGGLTQREVEVLRLIALGKSNRDIAEMLFVSPNTVANHVRSILTKTATANRTEAAAYALRYGLLED